MVPLVAAELGQEVEITQCHIKGNLKKHTDSLGLLPGEKITPVSKNDGGLIIKVKESRFAIEFGVASRIYVN